jgi:hypothetical protein
VVKEKTQLKRSHLETFSQLLGELAASGAKKNLGPQSMYSFLQVLDKCEHATPGYCSITAAQVSYAINN